MTRRSFLSVLLGGSAAALAGWGWPESLSAAPRRDDVGGPSDQPTLEEVARRFASLWASANTAALAGMLSPDGIRLNLAERGHASVGVRQASAALREFHEAHRPGRAMVTRVSGVEGRPPRGFAEVDWQTTTENGESMTYSLFVVFLQDGGGWWVSEIRVLR